MRPGIVGASAAVLAAVLSLAGCGGAGGAAGTTTTTGGPGGTYPAFLPKATLHPKVDAALVGTMTRPALQVEGLPVDVRTAHFDVRITVSGPVVPGVGLPNPHDATTCTWTIRMDRATGDVPVRLADFHSVDHLGSVFLMGLVPGDRPPPAVLHPGQTLTFRVRAYELVGEGQMQWAPDHRHVVAIFDYTVEND